MMKSGSLAKSRGINSFLSLVLISTCFFNLATLPASAETLTKIQVKFIEQYLYSFPATPKFPSTLRLKDVNFSSLYKKQCNNLNYGWNSARIMLASGRIVGERNLSRTARTTYFKWGTDEYGEKVLKTQMTCTGIGTIVVPQSNSYTFLVNFDFSGIGSGIGNCSPHYPVKYLKSKNWTITGTHRPDPESGEPNSTSDLVWSPSDPGEIPTHPASKWNLLCDRDDQSDELELPVDENGNCEPEGALYRARSNFLYTCEFSPAVDGLIWTK